MLLHAMLENQADGCAMLEAHEDPEVVRLRLGKALDFEYNEVRLNPTFKRYHLEHQEKRDRRGSSARRVKRRASGLPINSERAIDTQFCDAWQQDSFAGLFQRKDPREAGPILDIERALAKLEKVSARAPVPLPPSTSTEILT